MGLLSDIKRKRQFVWAALSLALTVMLLAGCSASDSDSAGKSEGGAARDSLKLPAGFAREDKDEALGHSVSDQSLASAPSGEKAMAAPNANSASLGSGVSVTSAEAFTGKIIYSANLTMRVEDIESAGSELRDIIHDSGGYILQFNDSRYDGEIGSLYTIKVPAKGFMPFVDRVAAIPNVKFQQTISGKDVSEEYVDLESRLKARRLVESRLLSMMEKAEKADDLLKFSNQLAEVQEQIEQNLGRIRYLDANVAYSTVELRVYQMDQKVVSSLEKEQSFGMKLADSLTGSASAVWSGLQLLLILFVGTLPVLAVLAMLGLPIYLYVKKRRKTYGHPVNGANDGNPPPQG